MESLIFVSYVKWKGARLSMGFLVAIILLVFLFDFVKLHKQNDALIKQNEQVIELLKEIKDK